MSVRAITLLGATGSIGTSTLDVVARHPDRFRVVALAANTKVDAMLAACRQVRPRYAAMADADAARRLSALVREARLPTEVLAGDEALVQLAALSEVDTVVAGIVGAAGLRSALAAAQAGKRILLANKEALVMAGHLFMQAVARSGAQLLPIDSEHNAILQSLPARFDGDLRACGVRRILLTASGGPFRTASHERMRSVTPAEACAHPNWSMGRKISVDSATLMNKGLEVIEAHWLFGATPAQIEVVVHPQSLVHSLVEFADGSVLAQLGNPDMRTALAHALAWPERIEAGVAPLDLVAAGALRFEAPARDTFRCLDLAYRALEVGGTAPTVLNAANEVAVAAFLEGSLPFLAIAELIEATLAAISAEPVAGLEHLLYVDLTARRTAQIKMRQGFC